MCIHTSLLIMLRMRSAMFAKSTLLIGSMCVYVCMYVYMEIVQESCDNGNVKSREFRFASFVRSVRERKEACAHEMTLLRSMLRKMQFPESQCHFMARGGRRYGRRCVCAP